MAKKTLDEYTELSCYENNSIGPMPYILVKLGLESEENINILCKENTDPSLYIKSNTKYEDFKKSMLKYLTEEYFEEKFSQYKNIDGYVGFCNCKGSITPIDIQDIKLTSKDIDKYTFDVTFRDLEMYEHYLNPEEGENIKEDDYLYNKTISFKYVNNNLVISQY